MTSGFDAEGTSPAAQSRAPWIVAKASELLLAASVHESGRVIELESTRYVFGTAADAEGAPTTSPVNTPPTSANEPPRRKAARRVEYRVRVRTVVLPIFRGRGDAGFATAP